MAVNTKNRKNERKKERRTEYFEDLNTLNCDKGGAAENIYW